MLAEELTGVGAEVGAEVLAGARTGELPEVLAGELPEVLAGKLPEVLAGELAEVLAGKLAEELGGLRTGGGEEGMKCSQ